MSDEQRLPPLPLQTLLSNHNLKPDQRLGQNFLVDEGALAKVSAASQAGPDDQVLEIGAGVGSLTRYLARRAGRVVAVEIDERFLPLLGEVLAPFSNVKVVQGDILQLDPAELMDGQPYLVAANIPYYITSAVIRHLLEPWVRPLRMVLTVQHEVAQRICASPGKLSLLALSVQVYGEPRIMARIPAGAFYPVPKVDSAVVQVNLAPEPQIPEAQLDLFFRLAKAGFSQKRKTLRNALAAGLAWEPGRAAELLESANLDPRRRAETLAIPEWGNLVQSYLGLTGAAPEVV